MCLVSGHNFRHCYWYWAWLVTPGRCNAASNQATLDAVPPGMDEFLAKDQEIMALALELDLPLEDSIQIGINIIAGNTTTQALVRFAERRERAKLGDELGHPVGWDTMDLVALREMADAYRRGTGTPNSGDSLGLDGTW